MSLNSLDTNSYLPRRVSFGWIGESWTFFGRAAGLWIVGVLLYGIVSIILEAVLGIVFPNPGYVPAPTPFSQHVHFQFAPQYSFGTNSNLTALGQCLSLFFSLFIATLQSASFYRIAVRQVRGQAVGYGDLVGGGSVFLNMLLFTLVSGLAACLGVVAFCVGLFVAVGLFLPGFALVADGQSATDAVRYAIAAMKQDWLNAALFIFVFSLIIAASALPCGLGMLATTPMLYLISALAYRDMVGMPDLPSAGYGDIAPQPGVWPPPPQM